jgi:hypothetical protein
MGESPSPFYYLLRFFDPTTGKEVARGKQYSTGHMAIYRHASSEAEQPLPALAEVPAMLRSRFSLQIPVEQPQYVMAAGLLLEPRKSRSWRAGINRSGKVSSLLAFRR